MNEIGGYLQFERYNNKQYYPKLIAVNTARNALIYAVRVLNIQKIYIPYFLCESIRNVCDREKIQYEEYHISEDFNPIFEKRLKMGEYIYIVNYYGQLNNRYIKILQRKYTNIIIDNVQSFYQKPVKGIPTIYSCRKYFGVPDGAYISIKEEIELGQDISFNRMKHILGRFEGLATTYYSDFKQNDKLFTNLPLLKMSKITSNLLGVIDYNYIFSRRNRNWLFLHKKLKQYNNLKIHFQKGPFMYPFYHVNGIDIKKKLALKNIYIPTLWPSVQTLSNCGMEKDYAENILPLPVDQRYTTTDMEYLVKELIKCIN